MLDRKFTKEKLAVLADIIAQQPRRGWDGPYDPADGDDIKTFYLFCMAQQCGTGLVTDQDTLTCGQVWDLYLNNWRGDRSAFRALTYDEFRKFILPEAATWTVSPGRLFTRFLIHNDIAAHAHLPVEEIANIGSLAADPYKKRLNLILNALHWRSERLAEQEGGPVVDYHVMRVLRRFLDIPVLDSATSDEEALRNLSWQCAWHLYNDHPLFHDQIDGFLWQLGRNVCRYDEPACEKCPLAEACARSTAREPRVETFFY